MQIQYSAETDHSQAEFAIMVAENFEAILIFPYSERNEQQHEEFNYLNADPARIIAGLRAVRDRGRFDPKTLASSVSSLGLFEQNSAILKRA